SACPCCGGWRAAGRPAPRRATAPWPRSSSWCAPTRATRAPSRRWPGCTARRGAGRPWRTRSRRAARRPGTPWAPASGGARRAPGAVRGGPRAAVPGAAAACGGAVARGDEREPTRAALARLDEQAERWTAAVEALDKLALVAAEPPARAAALVRAARIAH